MTIKLACMHGEETCNYYRGVITHNLSQLRQNGLKNQLLAGTDCSGKRSSELMPWGRTLHSELETFVEFGGFSAEEAIATATRNANKSLPSGNGVGVIKSGNWADLVILSKDPTASLSNLSKIQRVFKSGQIVWPILY